MSEVRVNNIVDYGGKGAPTFDNGAVISGVSSLGNQAKIGSNVTITSGGINVSGVTTAATLSGNLTGDVSAGFLTATSTVIGSGVTINAGGLNITGVVTATTFEGDGSSMTGVAMTIAPLAYNPDVNDSIITKNTGIGITFGHRILAGSGNVTLSIATNAGAAGTTVENFAVGSDVTIQGRKAIINPSSNLNSGETYHISYPSGAFTNTGGDVDYVGTAYTFGVKTYVSTLWMWGYNEYGQFGQNNRTSYSSPVQVGSENNWSQGIRGAFNVAATKTDGTLWVMGHNTDGSLGQNNVVFYSSPVQIPGTTCDNAGALGYRSGYGIKTDGTLWVWGGSYYGQLGLNEGPGQNKSSPIQIPGTTWDYAGPFSGSHSTWAVKTDGTLWVWGIGSNGRLGNNSIAQRSSPVQIPGTTWTNKIAGTADSSAFAIKSDNTMWIWGAADYGKLGLNQGPGVKYSSPVQLPGTTWKSVASAAYSAIATKTDGTAWGWGYNGGGQLAQNNQTEYSSPVQIGSDTTWDIATVMSARGYGATKTDGTLWSWGEYNTRGDFGVNNTTAYSSPVQVPGTTWDLENMRSHASATPALGGFIKRTT